MESSIQRGIRASSCSEKIRDRARAQLLTLEDVTGADIGAGQTMHSSMSANIEADSFRSQFFTGTVSQHEHPPLPHQLLNQKALQSHAESASMQFNSSHNHHQQVRRVFQPSQHPSFTTVREQRHIQKQPAAVDLHQRLGLKNENNFLHESKHQLGQTWTQFLPPNDFSGQQKQPELPQGLFPEVHAASVDSMCHGGNVHVDDWIGQAYRELQSVKEMCLSDLTMIYRKICYSCLQSSSTEQAAKLEDAKGCIDRMLQFLNMPRTEFIRFNKDRFYSSLYKIIKNVHTCARRSSISSHNLSQLPLLQQWLNSKLQSQAANPGLASGNAGSSLFQVRENRTNIQVNKTELDHNMPVAGADLRSILSSVHTRSSDPSALNTLQQINVSHMSVPPNSATLPTKLKQQMETPTRQTQAPSYEEKKHQMLIQRVNEINEKQQFENSHRSLFPSPFLKVSSRDTPPLSLGHTFPKQLPCHHPKGSPSKSIASLSVAASPSSPAITSSSPVCLEKYFSPISPVSVKDGMTPSGKSAEDLQPIIGESIRHSQRFVGATLTEIQNHLLALGTPEKSAPLSPVDLTCLKESQSRSDIELSPKCLSELVDSVSPKALIASVQDIMSVIILIDSLSGAMVTSDSLKTICDDLAADVGNSSGKMTSSLIHTTPNMIKRKISTIVPFLSSLSNENDSDGCSSPQTSNLELSDTSSKKRQRIDAPLLQLNDAVLEEIKQTNQSLIETVVDVASDFKEDIGAGFRVGTVVRCSFSAVGLNHNFKQSNTFIKLPVLLVELLVPEDYPKSSPQVLNTSSLSCCETRESEDLSERAKMKLNLSLRKHSEPFSLRDMAKAWDDCARSVLSEFAQSFGGGSFSSTYGTWESCSTAV